MHVLVVDDDDVIRQMMRRLISQLDCTTEEADSGLAALEAIRRDEPDLVLLDYMMPGMDGCAVLEQIRARPTWLPVIMVTAYSSNEQRQRAFELGADDVLDKPIDAPHLKARLRWLLRLHGAQKAILSLHEEQHELTEFLVHDMRNPLTVVQLALQEALDSPDTTVDRETMTDAAHALRRALGMLNDMLEVGRLNRTPTYDRHDLDASVLLGRLSSLFRLPARRRQITLSVDAPPEVRLYANHDLLTRVLGNLLENAMRYAPVKGRVHIEARQDGEAAQIVVANNGPAVPVENRQRIFDKYLSATRAPGQFGLGLYFCRRVAELHAGTIEVVETPEWPAMFVLRLPSRPHPIHQMP